MNREYYNQENSRVMDSYNSNILHIKEIFEKTADIGKSVSSNSLLSFINHSAGFLLLMADLEAKCSFDYFSSTDIQVLIEQNHRLYDELMGDNYGKSYANPQYAAGVFGLELGQLLSAFYTEIRKGISYAYKHRVFNLNMLMNTLIDMYDYVSSNGMEYDKLKTMITKQNTDKAIVFSNQKYYLKEFADLEYRFYLDTVMISDLTDLRYLYRYDKYISEYEIKTAQFLNSYPAEELKKMTKTIIDAYLRGFVIDNKDRGNRNIIRIAYFVGQELVVKQLIQDLKVRGFDSVLFTPYCSSPSKQFDYDHRYDMSLYFDESFAKLTEEAREEGFECCKAVFDLSAGPIMIDSFGEKPFDPLSKKECLKLSAEQEEQYKNHRSNLSQMFDKYEPYEKTSFTIIALPNAEIGEQFEAIFEDTVKINSMENDVYEKIQQTIIDAVDMGKYVHIKGANGNRTDIKIMLQELADPVKETNFMNCVADVNIPLGEIYTTPKLKGTNGILHLKDVFLELNYKNLELRFEDGCIVDYSCSNFNSAEENKNYVKENLLQLREKLPVGEFAIGTNTEAYVMAKKYDIIDVLPILIIEKMGPHFAIGDTCFTWAEELPVYNQLNGKRITAVDNEVSIQRKEDVSKAYTNVHTDITIPYEEIEFISVITKDNETIDIIRNGRFVLKGTEKLNQPFDRDNK
ncbi:MAG: aminopeptidase [Bacillota bacterium]